MEVLDVIAGGLDVIEGGEVVEVVGEDVAVEEGGENLMIKRQVAMLNTFTIILVLS